MCKVFEYVSGQYYITCCIYIKYTEVFLKKSKYNSECTGSTRYYVKQVLFLFRELHIYVTFSTLKTFP